MEQTVYTKRKHLQDQKQNCNKISNSLFQVNLDEHIQQFDNSCNQHIKNKFGKNGLLQSLKKKDLLNQEDLNLEKLNQKVNKKINQSIDRISVFIRDNYTQSQFSLILRNSLQSKMLKMEQKSARVSIITKSISIKLRDKVIDTKKRQLQQFLLKRQIKMVENRQYRSKASKLQVLIKLINEQISMIKKQQQKNMQRNKSTNRGFGDEKAAYI